jgi:maltooligosyltrehalose trehalohydrolase
LNWREVNEGKHAEMLAWTKSLIKLRRCTVALNDGSMQHLLVSSDDARRTLVMVRDEARIVANLGTDPTLFDLLEGEELKVVSREGLAIADGKLELPGMTLAVFLSTTEQAEDREVR